MTTEVEVLISDTVVEVLPAEVAEVVELSSPADTVTENTSSTPDILEIVRLPTSDITEVFSLSPTIIELVTSATTITEIVSPGPQGTQGTPGTGGDVTIPVLAAENIPQYTLVTAQGNIADSSNSSHYGKVVGMTELDISVGFIGQLVTDTEITNPFWAWSPGSKIFLNGTTLSTTPPSSGFSQRVAVARNATTIIMELGPPVLL